MNKQIIETYKIKKSKYTPEQLEGMEIAERASLFKQLFNEAVLEVALEKHTMWSV